MKIYVFKNKSEGSKYLANRVLEIVKSNPKASIGFAGGKTFIPMYDYLCQDYKINHTDWSNIKTFNLDEFENSNGTEPYSCLKYMKDHLFNQININIDNVWFPTVINATRENLHKDDEFLEKVRIPFQILGVGRNGHIGFNEPGSSEFSGTTKVKLSPSTIEDKANLFCNGNKDMIPINAVTVGIKKIHSAKKIVIVAFGESKNNAINQLLSNEVMTSKYPLTFMKDHKDVEVIIDKDCFGNIKPLSNLELNIIQ